MRLTLSLRLYRFSRNYERRIVADLDAVRAQIERRDKLLLSKRLLLSHHLDHRPSARLLLFISLLDKRRNEERGLPGSRPILGLLCQELIHEGYQLRREPLRERFRLFIYYVVAEGN